MRKIITTITLLVALPSFVNASIKRHRISIILDIEDADTTVLSDALSLFGEKLPTPARTTEGYPAELIFTFSSPKSLKSIVWKKQKHASHAVAKLFKKIAAIHSSGDYNFTLAKNLLVKLLSNLDSNDSTSTTHGRTSFTAELDPDSSQINVRPEGFDGCSAAVMFVRHHNKKAVQRMVSLGRKYERILVCLYGKSALKTFSEVFGKGGARVALLPHSGLVRRWKLFNRSLPASLKNASLFDQLTSSLNNSGDIAPPNLFDVAFMVHNIGEKLSQALFYNIDSSGQRYVIAGIPGQLCLKTKPQELKQCIAKNILPKVYDQIASLGTGATAILIPLAVSADANFEVTAKKKQVLIRALHNGLLVLTTPNAKLPASIVFGSEQEIFERIKLALESIISLAKNGIPTIEAISKMLDTTDSSILPYFSAPQPIIAWYYKNAVGLLSKRVPGGLLLSVAASFLAIFKLLQTELETAPAELREIIFSTASVSFSCGVALMLALAENVHGKTLKREYSEKLSEIIQNAPDALKAMPPAKKLVTAAWNLLKRIDLQDKTQAKNLALAYSSWPWLLRRYPDGRLKKYYFPLLGKEITLHCIENNTTEDDAISMWIRSLPVKLEDLKLLLTLILDKQDPERDPKALIKKAKKRWAKRKSVTVGELCLLIKDDELD